MGHRPTRMRWRDRPATVSGVSGVYPSPDVMARLQRSDNWVGTTGTIVDDIWAELRSS